jgi:hypothetical protein
MWVTVVPAAALAVVDDPCTRSNFTTWCGDGGPARQARLAGPQGVAPTRDGGFLIADTGNNVVRRVTADGTIVRLAGIGIHGHSGDGELALAARLRWPYCVMELASGAVLVQEIGAVRRISRSGRISTVSGRPVCQPAALPNGDQLVPGAGLADPDPDDDVYPSQNIVYRVTRDGSQVPVAGTGECLDTHWDTAVPALQAPLGIALGVAVLPSGRFLIADSTFGLIRRVSPEGIMTTVAGSRTPGGSPPGASASCGAQASYDQPNYLTIRQPLRARARRWVTLRVTSTNAGRLRAIVTRRGHVVYRKPGGRAREGRFRVRLRVRLPCGVYRVSLVNRGRRRVDGERQRFRKTATARLRITR